MEGQFIKAIRVRPNNANIDERLGLVDTRQYSESGYKGAISDVRVELYEDKKEWIINWLPISDTYGAIKQKYKKRDFPNSDDAIKDTILLVAKNKVKIKDLNIDADKYYAIIQDPWKNEAPMLRSFGNDPYFLNNGAKISIYWMIGDEFSVPVGQEKAIQDYPVGSWAGGTLWSNPDGTEIRTSNTKPQTYTQVQLNYIGDSPALLPLTPTQNIGQYINVKKKSGGGFHVFKVEDPNFQPGKMGPISFYKYNSDINDVGNLLLPAQCYTDNSNNSNICEIGGVLTQPSLNPGETIEIDITPDYDNFTIVVEYFVDLVSLTPTKLKSNVSNAVNSINPPTKAVIVRPNKSVEPYDTREIKKYVYIEPPVEIQDPTSFSVNGEEISDFEGKFGPDSINYDNINKILPSINFTVASDDNIIKKIIEIWKRKVPNYNNLKLCEPNYYPTVDIEYVDPINPISENNPAPTDTEVPGADVKAKFKLSVDWDKQVQIVANQDIPDIDVWLGDIPEAIDLFPDDFDDLSLLDDEFREAVFEGQEIQDLELSFERITNEAQESANNNLSDSDFIDEGGGSDVSGEAVSQKSVKDAIITVMKALINEGGFTVEEAAGICGNIKSESGFKYWNVENGASNIRPGGKGENRWDSDKASGKNYSGGRFSGMGLAQWTYGRRYNMEKYVGEWLTKKGVSTKALKDGFFDTDPGLHGSDYNQVYNGAGDKLEAYLKTVPYLFEAQASFLQHELNTKYAKIKTIFRGGAPNGNTATLIKNGFFVNKSGSKVAATVSGFAECVVCNFEVPNPVGKAIKGNDRERYNRLVTERAKNAADCLATWNANK